MAPLQKSRFSKGSTEEGSSHGRSSLPPLQVDKSFHNSWDDRLDKVIDANAATTSEGASGEPRLLPSRSERLIATRMNELSQLESPLLRKLAERLGAMLKLETPRCFKTFKHPYAELHVGDRWEEIQGCNDWKGLVESDFDRVLKGEILRYGEFAQATYDAFDKNTSSQHYGTCKYTKTDLLEQVGLENRGYEITNFLYATTNVSLYPNFLAWSKSGDVEGKSQKFNGDSKERNDESKHFTHTHSKENNEQDNESSQNGNVKCEHCSENSKQCNWIGFVAVCTSPDEIARLGRRDILVAWRGSVTKFDWIADFMDYMSPAAFGPDHASSHVRVEKGFLHLYKSTNVNSRYNHRKSARDQVRDAIKHLVGKYKQEGNLSITVTGHSLGSALATLCAYDIAECQYNLLSGTPSVSGDWHSIQSRSEAAVLHHEDGPSRHPHLSLFKDARHVFGSHGEGENGNHYGKITRTFEEVISGKERFVNKFQRDRVPVTVYSFGGPRVGNQAFGDRMQELGVAVLRVVNVHDRVPKVPGSTLRHMRKKLQQVITHLPSYKHVGVKLEVDNEQSEYLQKPVGPVRPHCLEAYLHLVDSYQGPGKTYEKTFRDIALVNKYKDFLKPKFGIPPCWWQEQNKGLVRDKNGEWRFPGRDETIPMTPPLNEEEDDWKKNVNIALERSKTALSHNSADPASTDGGHICE